MLTGDNKKDAAECWRLAALETARAVQSRALAASARAAALRYHSMALEFKRLALAEASK